MRIGTRSRSAASHFYRRSVRASIVLISVALLHRRNSIQPQDSECPAELKHRVLPEASGESATSFRVSGLDPAPFVTSTACRTKRWPRTRRYVADATPGFPNGIELRDAEPGETLLLLTYEHQPADTPYRASHAIFVREGAERAYESVGVIPEPLKVRPISLRAFNAAGEMVEADLIDGRDLDASIARFSAQSEVAYLHPHYAKRGCYAARIDRA